MHKLEIMRNPEDAQRYARYVLIVDDDHHYGQFLATLIERKVAVGTLLAETVNGALEQLASSSIGFVISDYNLEKERGTDLLELMRVNWAHIPFILTSADCEVAAVAQTFSVPFFAKTDRAILAYVNSLLFPQQLELSSTQAPPKISTAGTEPVEIPSERMGRPY